MLDSPVSEIRSVCHRSGRLISQTLKRGQCVRSDPPRPVICFCAPLSEWYHDLVST